MVSKEKTCYEAGCPFADKTTGSCNDKSCLAHPENTQNRKDARYFASLQLVEGIIWYQLNVCKRGLVLMKSPQALFDLYVDVVKNPYLILKKHKKLMF